MTTDNVNPQKARKGLSRIFHAGGYSLAGLKAGWGETAFRQEALLAIFLIPAAFWLGQTWVEVALLCGSVIFVMVVELLNTGIETAIDRIGTEWHALSKRAKDMGMRVPGPGRQRLAGCRDRTSARQGGGGHCVHHCSGS